MANFHTGARAHRSCLSVSSPDLSSNLAHRGYADKDRLDKIFQAMVLCFLECLRTVVWLLRIERVGLVSRLLCSSVRSMKTSAARGPVIRNPLSGVFQHSYSTSVTTFFYVFCLAALQLAFVRLSIFPRICIVHVTVSVHSITCRMHIFLNTVLSTLSRTFCECALHTYPR